MPKQETMAEVEKSDVDNLADLKESAKALMATIADFDGEIAALVKKRGSVKIRLRAITSKIVTLELRDSA